MIDFMKEKSEALMKFKPFEEKKKSETGCDIRCLHIDNGGEYTLKEFTKFLKQNKIR
jgi:transposase InsO family protein